MIPAKHIDNDAIYNMMLRDHIRKCGRFLVQGKRCLDGGYKAVCSDCGKVLFKW
jgi:hypothetical protein